MGIVGDNLTKPFSEKLLETQGLIARNIRLHPDRAVVSCSFGKDSLVVLWFALQLKPNIPVVFCNTGVEYPETIQFMHELTEAWNLNLIVTRPVKNYWQCVEEYGFAPGSKNTSAGKQCCYFLKEKPMLAAIREHGWTAVIDGVTAAESRQRMLRASSHGICYPHKHWKVQKVHPILWWRDYEVLDFIKLMDLPLNKLYAEGSKRVGCSTCTAYKNWEAEMQRLTPKLYHLIKSRMGINQEVQPRLI